MDIEHVLALSRSGDYMRLIEQTMSIPDHHCHRFEEVFLRVQFALAYQHAGVYNTSLSIYENVLSKTRHFDPARRIPNAEKWGFESLTWSNVRYNLELQKAVLLERLERIPEALAVFRKLAPPMGIRDLKLAKASLECWYWSTQIRLWLRNRQYSKLTSVGSGHADGNDKILGAWILFARTMYRVGTKKTSNLREFDGLNSILESEDLPGLPWFLLLEGEHLRDINITYSTLAFVHALKVSKQLGRFFMIAAAAEGLYVNLSRNRRTPIESLERYFLQQLRALSQCQLTAFDPYRTRLFRRATEELKWSSSRLANEYLKHQGMLRKRTDFQIGRMCTEHVSNSNLENKEAQVSNNSLAKKEANVFEEFITVWARNMFPGYSVKRTPAGLEAVDVVCTRTKRNKTYAKFIQVKLYSHPRDAVKKLGVVQRIKSAMSHLKVDRVEEYYFVVAKRGLEPWDDDRDWHAQDDMLLNERVAIVRVIPYTEPMLQTDILEMPELQDFFRFVPE